MSNEETYEELARDLVISAMEGINGTILSPIKNHEFSLSIIFPYNLVSLAFGSYTFQVLLNFEVHKLIKFFERKIIFLVL